MKYILILIFLTSCISTDMLNQNFEVKPVEYKQKPHRDFDSIDTLNVDTTRVPITFNPSVEDWSSSEDISLP